MSNSAFDSLLQDKTVASPGTFCDLIFFSDRQEREIPTKKELEDWVTHLIRTKMISLVAEDRFVQYDEKLPVVPFHGVGHEVYESALNEYRQIWTDFRNNTSR